MIRWLLAGVLALALGAGVVVFGNWTPFAPTYVQGVDVSHHQGPIDWRALANDGVAFAYIKASEGAEHVDPRFRDNWEAAARAGLKRGAYHFFTLCRPGAAQAAHFIAVVPSDPAALPPALDMEHKGPCRQGKTMSDVVGEMNQFLDAVEAHVGKRPRIYTPREFHDLYLRNVAGERFWIRSLFIKPRFREDDWVIWQHHNRGRKRGVTGPVDLNAFHGDEAALKRFSSPETQNP